MPLASQNIYNGVVDVHTYVCITSMDVTFIQQYNTEECSVGTKAAQSSLNSGYIQGIPPTPPSKLDCLGIRL